MTYLLWKNVCTKISQGKLESTMTAKYVDFDGYQGILRYTGAWRSRRLRRMSGSHDGGELWACDRCDVEVLT